MHLNHPCMARLEPSQLLAELAHFTGTTQYYYNPAFPNFHYTDGVKFLAEEAEAYWLLDFIFSNQLLPEIKAESFQVWAIEVENNEATITVDDGNGNVVKKFEIPYTDFPLEKYTLWFVDKALILKSEY